MMTTRTVTKRVKVFIPFEEFQRIHAALPKSKACKAKWCMFSRTTCHVRELLQGIQEWWAKTNGTAPGFANYELAIQNCIRTENKLYWAFWTRKMQPCRDCYDELVGQVRAAFEKQSLDTHSCIGHESAWPRRRN